MKKTQQLGVIFLILAVLVGFLFCMNNADALAGVSVGDYYESKTIVVPTVVGNKEIKYTQEMIDEYYALERAKEKPQVKPKQEVKKELVVPKEGKCTSIARQDLVNHAYKISGGDMKFLGTISSESRWHTAAVGDGGMSFGLCQIHKKYNAHGQKAYRELKTDIEKLEYCFKMYDTWNKKGIVEKRLYGSLVWKQGLKKDQIICN